MKQSKREQCLSSNIYSHTSPTRQVQMVRGVGERWEGEKKDETRLKLCGGVCVCECRCDGEDGEVKKKREQGNV